MRRASNTFVVAGRWRELLRRLRFHRVSETFWLDEGNPARRPRAPPQTASSAPAVLGKAEPSIAAQVGPQAEQIRPRRRLAAVGLAPVALAVVGKRVWLSINQHHGGQSQKVFGRRHVAWSRGVYATTSILTVSPISQWLRLRLRRRVSGNQAGILGCCGSGLRFVICGSGATCSTGWWRWQQARQVGAARF